MPAPDGSPAAPGGAADPDIDIGRIKDPANPSNSPSRELGWLAADRKLTILEDNLKFLRYFSACAGSALLLPLALSGASGSGVSFDSWVQVAMVAAVGGIGVSPLLRNLRHFLADSAQ